MNIDAIMSRLTIAGLALAAGGCTAVDPGMGETVQRQIAVQTINPAPDYAEPYESANGEKMAAAVQRYRSDRVKPPKSIRTTSGSGASSGGSGGSSQ